MFATSTTPLAPVVFGPSQLVGLTLSEASKLAKTHGYSVRPTLIDGCSRAVRMDFNTYRINVATSQDRVVGIQGIF